MRSASQVFTAAQSGAVLVSVPPQGRCHVYGVIFTAHANNTASPMMRVKLGAATIVEHPGVPAGGGLSMAGYDFWLGQGDDVLFDCDAPTGGSVAAAIAYEIL